MKKKSVVILVPNEHRLGGISNYYKSIKKYLPENYKYIFRGEKDKYETKLLKPFRLLYDYIIFFLTTMRNTDAIIINSSLGKWSSLRDGIYMLLCPFVKYKLVFFRGWKNDYQNQIDKSFIKRLWVNITFLNSDCIIVLSSKFKEKLIGWGYENSIYTETTLVDNILLDGLDIKSIVSLRNQIKEFQILYLGNISKSKGLWEIVESFKIISDSQTINCRLVLAGEGIESSSIKKFCNDNNLNATFVGYVKNIEKVNVYKNSDIFLFPSHTEGMPNAVLEALAFGLPVITRPVGGIPDFFEDGKMGYLTESKDPTVFAELIEKLINNPELRKQMSEYNYNYAKEHFYASKVAKRIQKIYEEVMNNGK